MRRSSRSAEPSALGDDGSAALEFVGLGVLLLVPLVYLILALGAIQGQSLGVEAAARHLARTVATAPDAATARERSDAVLAAVVDDYGIDAATVRTALVCRPATVRCPEPGATLVVTVSAHVALPLVPPVFSLDRVASVPIEASAVQKVSRLWGSG